MKTKIMIIALTVITTTITMISCKSDYTCNCQKVRTTSSGGTIITADGSYTYKTTKGTASTRCNALEYAGTDSSGNYYRQCQD